MTTPNLEQIASERANQLAAFFQVYLSKRGLVYRSDQYGCASLVEGDELAAELFPHLLAALRSVAPQPAKTEEVRREVKYCHCGSEMGKGVCLDGASVICKERIEYDNPSDALIPVGAQLDKLEADLRSIKDAATESSAGDPPEGYDDLDGTEAQRVADTCWQNGLDAMETAIRNWIHDQRALTPYLRTDREPCRDTVRLQLLADQLARNYAVSFFNTGNGVQLFSGGFLNGEGKDFRAAIDDAASANDGRARG